MFDTNEVDSQANIEHPGDLYADKVYAFLFKNRECGSANDSYGQVPSLGNGLSILSREGWEFTPLPHVPD